MDQIAATYGLTKRYKDFCAVSQLDMTVREGRIYGFLGPNGAGKSTTLKMLLGLVQPSAGSIELMGKPMNGRNRIELLRSTGSLIESPSFYGHLTARENLRIYTTLLGLPEKNIDEALKIVRLDRQEGKRLSAYSLGMKQRSGRERISSRISCMPERCGMTVIISSHILSEIDRIVDDIGIIANGELRYQGELERLHEIDEGKTLEEIFLDMTGKDLSL